MYTSIYSIQRICTCIGIRVCICMCIYSHPSMIYLEAFYMEIPMFCLAYKGDAEQQQLSSHNKRQMKSSASMKDFCKQRAPKGSCIVVKGGPLGKMS